MRMLKALWGMLTGRIDGVRMIKCEEALESLFEYLDGEIDEPRRAAIEKHLEICRACYPRAQFERAFLSALERVDAGERTPAGLRERVLASLQAESG